MATRNMSLDVIVRLKDLLSGPLRGLRNALSGIADMAKKIGIVSAAVAGISFLGPMQEAAAFQQKLLDITGTQGLVGSAAFSAVADMKSQFQNLAREVGMSSQDIAGAAGQMIAAGLDTSVVQQTIRDIARTTTAANADINDLGGVATSLMQNLDLGASQMRGALDGLAVAGKLGSFELKDMARYFPTLTGEVAKFGVKGREAVNFLGAALQVARKGTADPSEAANNLRNFLNKIMQPVTVKSFADMGVDIQGVMKNAVLQGINPIEAVIQKISMLTKVSGAEIDGLMKKAKASGKNDAEALNAVREQLTKIHGAGKLGELFSDMQVTGFLIPALANIQNYKDMKAEIADATGTVTDADFQTQMQGLNRELKTFTELMSQVSDEIGNAFGKWMPLINQTIGKGLDLYREFNKESNGMGTDILVFGGAAVIAAAGLGALAFFIPVITAGIGALLTPLRLIAPLFGRFGRASQGARELADGLERVNSAATRAQGIQRPSIWSVLFGAGAAANLVAAIPDNESDLQSFFAANAKRSEGWNNWLQEKVGTPRSWLGLDDAKASMPEVDTAKIDELRTSLTGITVKWPFAAQQGMRDFIDVLNAGGADAVKKSSQIGDDMKAHLQIVASPDIETGKLEEALKIARELSATIRGIGTIPNRALAVNDNGQTRSTVSAEAIHPAVAHSVEVSGHQADQPAKLSGRVVIGLDPKLRIVEAGSDTPGVTIGSAASANTGRVIGRN